MSKMVSSKRSRISRVFNFAMNGFYLVSTCCMVGFGLAYILHSAVQMTSIV